MKSIDKLGPQDIMVVEIGCFVGSKIESFA